MVLNPSAHFQRLSSPIYRNELKQAFALYEKISKLSKIEKELIIEAGKIFSFDYPASKYSCSLVVIEGDSLVSIMPKCLNIRWKYNGIDYYDFVTGAQNLSNTLITAKPKLNKFVDRLISLPLGITEEIFMKNCLVDGTPLDDYLGGIKVSFLILQSVKA